MTNNLDDASYRANDARKQQFARNLRRALADRQWSQSDLARRASEHMPEEKQLSKQTVSHFVNGLNMPSPRAMLAIAQCLNMKPSDLDPAPSTTWLDVESRAGVKLNKEQIDIEQKPVLTIDSLDGMANLNISAKVPVEVALKIMDLLKNA